MKRDEIIAAIREYNRIRKEYPEIPYELREQPQELFLGGIEFTNTHVWVIEERHTGKKSIGISSEFWEHLPDRFWDTLNHKLGGLTGEIFRQQQAREEAERAFRVGYGGI